MATTRWLSSLADFETRLRRVLRLAGPIETQLEAPATIQPVVLVGDATIPGANVGGMHGRRWMSYFGNEDIPGANYSGSFLHVDTSPCRGVIIDKVDVSQHTSATITDDRTYYLHVFPPGSTPNAGAEIRLPMFVEGMVSSTDYAPLTYADFSSAAPPTGGGAVVSQWGIRQPADSEIVNQFPLSIFLLPGSWIGLIVSPSGDSADEFHFHATWYGRAF